MSYSYQFRLKIIKLVTEQDYGIREVAKLHKISHALVIYWLKAFRQKSLECNRHQSAQPNKQYPFDDNEFSPCNGTLHARTHDSPNVAAWQLSLWRTKLTDIPIRCDA